MEEDGVNKRPPNYGFLTHWGFRAATNVSSDKMSVFITRDSEPISHKGQY